MDYEQHRSAVVRECASIVTGIRAGPMDLQVPTCPEWTLVQLSTHLGQFCGLWSHVLCEATGRPKTPFEDPDPGTTGADWFAGWFDQQAGYLLELLAVIPAESKAWTWDPTNNTAGFIARRAAHELAVHRFDVQTARSQPAPIDGALAVDGIEEIFAMIGAWQGGARDMGKGQNESLHLHASAPEAEWTITLTPEGPSVEHSHRRADLALRGSASDLELVLYDRPPIGQVEHLGDDHVLEVWRRAFHFG